MSSFDHRERKGSTSSTHATPTSHWLRPSRPLAPLPTAASRPVPPVTQAQLEHAARFGHSLDRISIFPPATHVPQVNKAEQAGALVTMQQAASPSASIQSEQSSHPASTTRQASLERTTRLGHSFARIPLFPPEKKNNSGLPDSLKAGVEQLSGLSLDDVHVHYNSSKPAQLQALAHTQGRQIHVGPGQEKHLPHEAWHVVQQKQGRVQPTLQRGGVEINDDQGLEREAEMMGAKALQIRRTDPLTVIRRLPSVASPSTTLSATSLQSSRLVVPSSSPSGSVIQRVLFLGPKSLLFKVRNMNLFDQIRTSVQNIITVDPEGERDMVTEEEALHIATEVLKLKSLAEKEESVARFFKNLGTFTSNYTGEQGRTFYEYLNSIDARDCGATTVHVFLEVWRVIK